jgi:hypothetical protein
MRRHVKLSPLVGLGTAMPPYNLSVSTFSSGRRFDCIVPAWGIGWPGDAYHRLRTFLAKTAKPECYVLRNIPSENWRFFCFLF